LEKSGQLHALAALPPQEITPSTHWIGWWVGPRADQNAVGKRKVPNPCWELNPDHPAHGLVTILTELSHLRIFMLWYLINQRDNFTLPTCSHLFRSEKNVNKITSPLPWGLVGCCNM